MLLNRHKNNTKSERKRQIWNSGWNCDLKVMTREYLNSVKIVRESMDAHAELTHSAGQSANGC
jgi:hypothetical protein